MLRRSRAKYWSCGPVLKWTAKLLGAPPKPSSGTMEEWNTFRKNQSTNFKLQDRIENTLKVLQNIWSYPGDIVYTIQCYCINRFKDKIHILETGLEKGQYYDYDWRLMHGMFNSFQQFIEKEQRLDNLKWEMTLVNKYEWLPEDEAKGQPDYGQPCPQALKAVEKMKLYTWWKTERPARIDGYIASGFKAYADASREPDDGVFSLWVDKGEEENAKRRALTTKWHEIDEAHEQEDEEMMIRLVKLRRSLWT